MMEPALVEHSSTRTNTVHKQLFRKPRHGSTISLMFAESKTSPSFNVAETKKILVSAK